MSVSYEKEWPPPPSPQELSVKFNEVIRAAPQAPFTHAEYNAWMLRLQKVQEEIDQCLLRT